jgi:glutamate synthase domain-containing protein 3
VRDPAEIETLRALIERHLELTGSERAQEILEAWPKQLKKFWKVAPKLSPTESDSPASESPRQGDSEAAPVPQSMRAQPRALASSEAGETQYEAPPPPI